MKASELIKELEDNTKEHGDCQIAIRIGGFIESGECFDDMSMTINVEEYTENYFVISGTNI